MRKQIGIGATIFACAVAGAVLPGLASATGPHVCSGTAKSPGVLSGNYRSGVDVKGVCVVNKGRAHVLGTLRLQPKSVLLAAFGMNHSRLTVSGDVNIGTGATLLLGCSPTSSPCLDEPNQKQPTLTSKGHVSGDLIATAPRAVIVHGSVIGGDVKQVGGGGGVTCKGAKTGIFAGSPVFSVYDDSTLNGNVKLSRIKSCWLGLARDQIGGSLKILKNKLADRDAIEVLTNTIQKNLVCRHNRPHMWDSTEKTSHLFPRKLERNTVRGKRVGQCVKAGPLTRGGPPAGGPF
jgi:hypothetical protein